MRLNIRQTPPHKIRLRFFAQQTLKTPPKICLASLPPLPPLYAPKRRNSRKTPPVQEAPVTPQEKQAALDKIAEEIKACRRCPLGQTRIHAVPGEGNPRRGTDVYRRRPRL